MRSWRALAESVPPVGEHPAGLLGTRNPCRDWNPLDVPVVASFEQRSEQGPSSNDHQQQTPRLTGHGGLNRTPNRRISRAGWIRQGTLQVSITLSDVPHAYSMMTGLPASSSLRVSIRPPCFPPVENSVATKRTPRTTWRLNCWVPAWRPNRPQVQAMPRRSLSRSGASHSIGPMGPVPTLWSRSGLARLPGRLPVRRERVTQGGSRCSRTDCG